MSSGKKRYHEVRNVMRWEEMLLGGKKCYQEVKNVIRWEEMSSGD